MSTHTKILWPSHDNCQLVTVADAPFQQFASMMSDIYHGLTDAEKATARFINTGAFQFVCDHTDSSAEVAACRDAIVAEMLTKGETNGLTKEELAAFAARLAGA